MASSSLLRERLHELLAKREHPKTICPSEVARSLSATELSTVGASEWRDTMPAIREIVWELRDNEQVEILQRGEVLGADVGLANVKGPVRVRKKQC